jgi:hypothetical protein
MSRSMLMVACALMLTACGNLPLQPEAPLLQASLREPCPDLSPPADGTRASVLHWSIDTAQAYRECQSKHRRTVEAFPKEK